MCQYKELYCLKTKIEIGRYCTKKLVVINRCTFFMVIKKCM